MCRRRLSVSGAPRMFNKIAVMPDVHLAADVCIGVVIATSHLIYPQAVGGDIGCGMLAVAVDVEAAALKNPKTAAQLLNDFGRAIPSRRRNRNAVSSTCGDSERSAQSCQPRGNSPKGGRDRVCNSRQWKPLP